MANKQSKKLHIVIGIPGSGKSTYALKLIKQNNNWVRVNRDDIRINNFGTEHNPHIENQVTKIEHFIIHSSLESGYNVVVDNCNIKLSYRNEYKKIAESVGNVLYDEHFVNTSFNQCIEWNKSRARQVPEDILVKFYKQASSLYNGKETLTTFFYPTIAGNGYPYITQNEDLPEAIICDLDGTLAFMGDRSPYDASTCDKDIPNPYVINILEDFHENDYQIIFLSGREDKYLDPTCIFLANNISFDDYLLYMRKSGDSRKDSIIKKEIYKAEIENKYNIMMIMDDRLQVCNMWHELGLPLFRVGDPKANF